MEQTVGDVLTCFITGEPIGGSLHAFWIIKGPWI